MIRQARSGNSSDEIVRSTLTEIVLVLLFFFLVLLASQKLPEAARAVDDNLGSQTQIAPVVPPAQIDVEGLMNKVNKLGGQVDAAQQKIGNLENALNEAQKTLENAKSERQKAIADLDVEIEEKMKLRQALIKTAGDARRNGVRAQRLDAELTDTEKRLAEAIREVDALNEKLTIAEAALEELETPFTPVFEIDDTDKYFFALGKSLIDEDFEAHVKGAVATQIRENAELHDFDTIDVIGHTDGSPVNADGRRSTIDQDLILQAQGTKIQASGFVDNTGLGMLRAAAVVALLREVFPNENIRILPYSAGQAILPGDYIADAQADGDDPERRRIEIRLRKQPDRTINIGGSVEQ